MTRSKFVGIRITAEMQSHLAAIAHHYQWHTLSACFRGAVKLAHRLMPSLPAAQQTFQYGFDDYNEPLPALLNIQPEKLSNGQTLAEFETSVADLARPATPDSADRTGGDHAEPGDPIDQSNWDVEIGVPAKGDRLEQKEPTACKRRKAGTKKPASKRAATAAAAAAAKRPAATNGSVKRAGKRGAK